MKVTEDQFVEAIMQEEGLIPKCQQSIKDSLIRKSSRRSFVQQVLPPNLNVEQTFSFSYIPQYQMKERVSSPMRPRSAKPLTTYHGY